MHGTDSIAVSAHIASWFQHHRHKSRVGVQNRSSWAPSATVPAAFRLSQATRPPTSGHQLAMRPSDERTAILGLIWIFGRHVALPLQRCHGMHCGASSSSSSSLLCPIPPHRAGTRPLGGGMPISASQLPPPTARCTNVQGPRPATRHQVTAVATTHGSHQSPLLAPFFSREAGNVPSPSPPYPNATASAPRRPGRSRPTADRDLSGSPRSESRPQHTWSRSGSAERASRRRAEATREARSAGAREAPPPPRGLVHVHSPRQT